MAKVTINPEYQPFPDCQIPDLAAIYQHFLTVKTNGYFVEVGAYDGQSISNTAFLADLGWQGIYIEPVKAYADLCRRRHQNNAVQTFQLAVGKREKNVKVYIGGDISTTIANPKQFYESIGFPEIAKQHSGKSTIVKQTTLEKLLIKAGAPKNFDLLVLDTEGTEWDILSVFPISRWRPKMVIVEMHEKSLDWTKAKSVRQNNLALNAYFEKARYKKVYSDDINTIFVHSVTYYYTEFKQYIGKILAQ